MTDPFVRRSDAVIIEPVSFAVWHGETGSERHRRRAKEAMSRVAEIEDIAAELGDLDLSKPKWVRLLLDEAEVTWSPSEANMTALVRGVRLPSAHVLDVDGWAEQVRSIARTGALEFNRARPYACPVIVWRDDGLVFARSCRKRGLRGLEWDEHRRAHVGSDREVLAAIREVHAGMTGVTPTRVFPIGVGQVALSGKPARSP